MPRFSAALSAWSSERRAPGDPEREPFEPALETGPQIQVILRAVEPPAQRPSADKLGEPPRTIGRQVAVGFGLVAIIAGVMCLMLLATIREVGGVVERMRRDEAAIQAGIRLSAGVREQYIHIAHSLIEGDGSHLGHYERWAEQVEADARAQADGAPQDARRRLQTIVELAAQMDEVFRADLLPAARQGRLDDVRVEHRRVEHLSRDAAAHADAVAATAERRMASAHDEAQRAASRGAAIGLLCVLAVFGVAGAYTVRLRSAVLRPLAALTRAAGRFGRGDFGHRVGAVGEAELAELARAFDRMAEELAAREQEILSKERMAAIGRLAAGVAHEINNPIGIIRGYVKTMIPEATSAELRAELEVLDEEAAACQRLTGDLLAYAETPRLEHRRVQMRAFLEDAVARLRETLELEDHALAVHAQEADIDADPVRLRQVLANLVRNAAQVSPDGAPIVVTGELVGGTEYQFTVRDSGPGVAAEDQTRIFEPFFSKRRGGSGLGLAVSRSIIEAHGGSIGVEPSSDGACFRVVVPTQPPRSSNDRTRS